MMLLVLALIPGSQASRGPLLFHPCHVIIYVLFFTQDMLRNCVKVSNTGAFYGLLIQKRFADRFLSGKSLEIRSRPVNFLQVGECIALVSCQATHGRQVIAILEFEKCFKIYLESFQLFQPRHRLTNVEMEAFKTNASAQGFVWAWQFSLRHAFSSPLSLPRTNAQVWVLFNLEEDQKARSLVCVLFTRAGQAFYSNF